MDEVESGESLKIMSSRNCFLGVLGTPSGVAGGEEATLWMEGSRERGHQAAVCALSPGH